MDTLCRKPMSNGTKIQNDPEFREEERRDRKIYPPLSPKKSKLRLSLSLIIIMAVTSYISWRDGSSINLLQTTN